MQQDRINIENDEFLTIREVMTMLKISRSTLWKLTTEKKIQAIKIGNSVRYSKSKVLERFRIQSESDLELQKLRGR